MEILFLDGKGMGSFEFTIEGLGGDGKKRNTTVLTSIFIPVYVIPNVSLGNSPTSISIPSKK
jgi:hypothetical protein